MKRALILAAAFGLSTAAAQACDYQKSAKADTMTVASIATDVPQSTADAATAKPAETPAEALAD